MFRKIHAGMALALCCSFVPAVATGAENTGGGDEIKIVAFGTSFTHGQGEAVSLAFPARLETLLRAEREKVQIANQGISGDVTPFLLQRLDSSVPEGTQIVLFEPAFGNDHDARIDRMETFKNINEIISRLVARNIQVMLIVRWRDEEGLQKMRPRFEAIAARHGIQSFLLYRDPATLANDGQHPSADEHLAIARRMLPKVRTMIEKVRSRSTPKAGS